MDLGYKAYEMIITFDITYLSATRLLKTYLKDSLYVCISNEPPKQTPNS